MTDRSNLVGRVPPTPTDDVNKGYGVGSRWTDKTHNRKYTCTDATNRAAIWIEDMADVTDAASVEDAGAVMDSDFVDNDGFMHKTGEGTYEVIKSNMEASTAPTTADDSNSGYAIGSRWFDLTSGKEYVCLDATIDVAVWIETTSSYTDAEAVAAIAAVNAYLKKDGSETLTSDWDIGNDRKVLADEIRARDGDGLKIYDDGGNGIFVKDSGKVGIKTTDPKGNFDIGSTPAASNPRAVNIHDSGVDGAARMGFHGTAGMSASPGLEMTIDGSSSKRILMVLVEEGSNDYGMRFYTTNNGLVGERMRITGNGTIGINTAAPTAKLDINSDILRLRTAKTPASAGAAGNQGDLCWDADYIYVCTATNTWERTPHAWDINIYDDAAVTKLAGVEAGADVTDATNVAAAGAIMQGASSTTPITAAGGITVTHRIMRIVGNMAAVNITKNPQISAGSDGQEVILPGTFDAWGVTIDDGDGVSLAGGASFTIGERDMLMLAYDSGDGLWVEISRSNN